MISTVAVPRLKRPTAPVTLMAVSLLFAFGGAVVSLATWAPDLVFPVLAGVVGVGLLMGAWSAAPMLGRLLPKLRWWHLGWAALFLSDFTFRVRSVDTLIDNPLDAWAMYRIGLVGLVALTLLVRVAMKATPRLAFLSNAAIGWMTVFAVIDLVSVAWSVYPAWTLYKSLEFFTDLGLLAAIMATVRGPREYRSLLDFTWVLYGALILVVWVEVLIWPSQALERGQGILGIAINGVVPALAGNSVGRFGAILAVVAMTRLIRPSPYRRFYGVAFLLSLTSLIFAQSRGAVAGFVCACFVLLIAMRRRALFGVVALAALIVLLTPVLRDTVWQYLLRGEDSQMVHSLSGRTDWWTYGLQRFWDRPLLGYGGYAGPRFAVLADIGAVQTASLHNTWLEVLLSTGVVGLIPLLAAVGAVGIALWRFRAHAMDDAEPGSLWLEATGALIVLLVTSVFNTELVLHPALFYLAIVGYTQHLRVRPRVRTGLFPGAGG